MTGCPVHILTLLTSPIRFDLFSRIFFKLLDRLIYVAKLESAFESRASVPEVNAVWRSGSEPPTPPADSLKNHIRIQ